jgi:hypothetical protein
MTRRSIATKIATTKLVRGLVLGLMVAACGSRTGLLISEDATEGEDSGPPGPGIDASGIDSPFPPPGFDAQPPGFDSQPPPPPPIDANKPDVPIPNDCPDADSTLIYLLDGNQGLHSFFPPTLEFKNIATLACPAMDENPYSMAVDRKGKAFALFARFSGNTFTQGDIFEVSTATAACAATKYVPNQSGFITFGMGFSGTETTESLYVAQADINNTGMPTSLGTIDTTTLQLSVVGTFTQPLPRCELTGTGDGRLFAFCVNTGNNARGSIIAQIDPGSGTVLGENKLQAGSPSDAFAFAYWGGSFWIFTSDVNTQTNASTVTQYDLDTQTESTATTVPAVIVGAGVSTCAPR